MRLYRGVPGRILAKYRKAPVNINDGVRLKTR